MSFSQLFLSSDGRIGLRTFWLDAMPIMFILNYISGIPLWQLLNTGSLTLLFTPLLVIELFILWVILVVLAKRWHDINQSGWWGLLILVPIIGMVLTIIVAGTQRSVTGPNKYGEKCF